MRRVTPFVSRAGEKLEHALSAFALDVGGCVCADLGCNAGGFTDCLLRRGAAKVYAVDTGYGMLDWRLRKDARVVVMERTNALRAELPEKVGLVVVDVAWTRQKVILPAARRLLGAGGRVVTLVKPHYEAEARQLRRGVLVAGEVAGVLERVRADVREAGFEVVADTESPLLGGKGNREMLWLLTSPSS